MRRRYRRNRRTVGDQIAPFLEAIRQDAPGPWPREHPLRPRHHPLIAAAQELKTKPTRHPSRRCSPSESSPTSSRRSDRAVPREMRAKIALFCNVEEQGRRRARRRQHLRGPAHFLRAGAGADTSAPALRIETPTPDPVLSEGPVHRAYHPIDEVSIGIVGKYVEHEDPATSPSKSSSTEPSPTTSNSRVTWISRRPRDPRRRTAPTTTSISSKVSTASSSPAALKAQNRGHAQRHPLRPRDRHALLRHLPGMQTACIEYARNVCGLKDANPGEFDPGTPHRIIYKPAS